MAEDSSEGTRWSAASPEGTNLADPFASDFKPPELGENRSRLSRLWSLVMVAQEVGSVITPTLQMGTEAQRGK